MQWRWQVEDRPGDPWGNMAADAEALTGLREEHGRLPSVRVYQWDRPSVSIGRLQSEEAVRQLYADLPIVRRPTGGRAVVHGQDLTISITTRTDWLPGTSGQGIMSSYRQIMAGVLNALQESGIPTSFGTATRDRHMAGVVNCFDISAGCDLVDNRTDHKVVGSAQRREQNVILQQMSLPLAPLPDITLFIQSLQTSLQKALQVDEWIIN